MINPASGINIQDINRADMAGHLYRVSEKIDGVRRIFHKNKDGIVRAFSRTFKPDTLIPHICSVFETNVFPLNTYYDCELVDRELYFDRADSFELRTTTNSKASQEYPDNKRDLMAICFDYFSEESPMEVTMKRTTKLMQMFMYLTLDHPVVLVPIFGNVHGENLTLINQLMDNVIKQGGEGVMLQDCDLPYIQGRTKHLIKVKKKEEFIGTIKDIEMAGIATKIAGGARAVICDVDRCSQDVRVGSGFTDEERFYIAEYQDNLIGKEIEIEAFGISIDKNGETSLSMPIFKNFVDEEIVKLLNHYSRKEVI